MVFLRLIDHQRGKGYRFAGPTVGTRLDPTSLQLNRDTQFPIIVRAHFFVTLARTGGKNNLQGGMQNSFFQELLKRKVFRGIALYVVAAWLLMQAGEIVLPAFGLPDSALRILIITLVAGLPVAALFSWAFEVSTSGIRRESKVAREAKPVSKFGRSFDFVIIGVLTILVSYFGWHYFTTGSPVPEAAASEPSIAVLPFVNMSGDEANEYFSDGISEELLNALAKVPELKVAGRTSSFSYKGKNEDLRTIGEQLGVATVLEGSVRKANDRVRVTAQLVKTSDGFHLWSETYDYELDDIFKVQDEIAAAVVTELKGRLLGQTIAPTPESRKTDGNTYAYYLQGREALHERRKETIVRSEALFKQALELDPDYAPAWVGLAESYMLQHINHKLMPLEEAEAKADEAIERALALDPDSAEAYAALGLTRMEAKRYEEAKAAFERSLEINPNYAEALHWSGLLHRWTGDPDTARRQLRRSVELDPLHRVARTNYADLLLSTGDFEQAKTFIESSIRIAPDYAGNQKLLAGISWLGPMPRPGEALGYVEQAIVRDPEDDDLRHFKIGILLEMDDVEGARSALEEFRAAIPGSGLAEISEFAINSYANGATEAARVLRQKLNEIEGLDEIFRNAFIGITALIAEDYAEARAALEAMNPRLTESPPEVDVGNLQFAAPLAITYDQTNDQERLSEILAAMESHLEDSQRFGFAGFNLTDVEIAILRDQPDEAMEKFQQAFDEGYRNRTIEGLWRLADYPGFETIKDRADFKRLINAIEQYHNGLRSPAI